MAKGRVISRLLIATLCLAAPAALYLQAYVSRPYEPQQPLPFSHTTHTAADQVHMPCLACHPGAERAVTAGLPTEASCMDCHRHILSQDPRLLPLHAAADPDSPAYTGDPLLWRRAHALPAYAHFHHAAHTKRYDCERCHPTPGSEAPMRMRDCLECHREERQPADCTRCHR